MKGERMLLKETAWSDSAHHPSAWRLGGRAEGPAREPRVSPPRGLRPGQGT